MSRTQKKMCLIGSLIVALFVVAPPAIADVAMNASQVIVIQDDIWKTTTEIERPGDAGSPSGGDTAAAGADSGAGDGKSNNGHGNNEDGVDSSNPSNGEGGPNGEADASCPTPDSCVDDEAGGGSGKSNGKKK